VRIEGRRRNRRSSLAPGGSPTAREAEIIERLGVELARDATRSGRRSAGRQIRARRHHASKTKGQPGMSDAGKSSSTSGTAAKGGMFASRDHAVHRSTRRSCAVPVTSRTTGPAGSRPCSFSPRSSHYASSRPHFAREMRTRSKGPVRMARTALGKRGVPCRGADRLILVPTSGRLTGTRLQPGHLVIFSQERRAGRSWVEPS
jgi:hypothetical protein